jgi:hypothetical protein
MPLLARDRGRRVVHSMHATDYPTEVAWQIVSKMRRPVPHPALRAKDAGRERLAGAPATTRMWHPVRHPLRTRPW